MYVKIMITTMQKSRVKIIKYKNNSREKSMKLPFIIHPDLESLLEKMRTYHNSPEKLSTTKVDKHTGSGYSMFTHCSFNCKKGNLDCYRGKDCMERFFKDLKEHVLKIINYEKTEIIPLTYEKNKSYKKQEVCYI